MTEKKFKIGERVKCIDEDSTLYGKTGTVVTFKYDFCGVKWDGVKGGHSCDGVLKGEYSRSGLYVHNKYLERDVSKEKLIIYIQDNKVVCQQILPDGTKGFKTFANCAPTDNFNMIVGAQIALMRMAKVNEAPIVMDKHISFGKLQLEDIL